MSSPTGTAVYRYRAHLNLSPANSSRILDFRRCRQGGTRNPMKGQGYHPNLQMLAFQPLEESPCAWSLGDTGGAEGGVESLPWAWASKMRIQAISLHGNRSPAVTKQPGSSLAGSGSPERLCRGGWNGPGWSPVESLWEWAVQWISALLSFINSHIDRGQHGPCQVTPAMRHVFTQKHARY